MRVFLWVLGGRGGRVPGLGVFGFRGLGPLGSRGFTVKGLERVALGVSTVQGQFQVGSYPFKRPI